MLGTRSLRPRPWLFRALCAASLVALAACEDRRGGDVEVYPGVAATVISVEVERRVLLVDHAAIPGVMEAMTMPLEVEDPALLEGVAAGDSVDLTLRRIDGRVSVWALERRARPAAAASPAARPGLLGEES